MLQTTVYKGVTLISDSSAPSVPLSSLGDIGGSMVQTNFQFLVDRILSPTYGGTGIVNNSANTLTFSGNYSLGLILSNNTSLTLPNGGTVAVSLTMPTWLTAATTDSSGNIAVSAATGQTTNRFLATPNGAGTGSVALRAIVASDIPTLNQSTSGNASTATNISTFGSTAQVWTTTGAFTQGWNTITSLGTITTGVWNGTVISPVYGGTGIANNSASTLTISGAHATTFTITNTTSVTFPTSGTLMTTIGNTSGNAGNVTGTVAIANGGTGQTTAQTAIDALTQVSGATNAYVLTKDTATGHALWKVASGGGGSSVGTVGKIQYTDGSGGFLGTSITTDGTGIEVNGGYVYMNNHTTSSGGGTLYMDGGTINMAVGAGSAGGVINMDQGTINNAYSITATVYSGITYSMITGIQPNIFNQSLNTGDSPVFVTITVGTNSGPTTSSLLTLPSNIYGGSGGVLGQPTTWLNINGYQVPAY